MLPAYIAMKKSERDIPGKDGSVLHHLPLKRIQYSENIDPGSYTWRIVDQSARISKASLRSGKGKILYRSSAANTTYPRASNKKIFAPVILTGV